MNSPTPSSIQHTDDTLDVLDLLITLAENLRLLVLGPIVVGAVAFGMAQLLPKVFESTATLKAAPPIATLMTSAPVLNAALHKLGYTAGMSETDAEAAVAQWRRKITAEASSGDALVTLKVKASTPEAAQQLANEVLSNTFAASKPVGAELQRLSDEKAVLAQQAVKLTTTSKTAQQILEKSSAATDLGSVAASIAVISNNLVQIQERTNKVDEKLLGVHADDVLEEPSLSKRPIGPNKTMIAIFATLATAFLLVIFVFIRHAWQSSCASFQHQARLDALKRRYGMRK